MRKVYEVDINYCGKYRNETLMDVIRNMDGIEKVSEEMFKGFMTEVRKRRERVEGIKSRVNRISSIMAMLNGMQQSFVFKTKKYYPRIDKDDNEQVVMIGKQRECVKVNNHPLNSSNVLGLSPENNTYDDILESREMINYDAWNNDIQSKLSLIDKTIGKKINPVLNNLSSAFQWNNTSINLLQTPTLTIDNNLTHHDTSSLNESMNIPSHLHKPYDAPVSIRDKESMKHSNNKPVLALPKKQIELNLPMFMKLGNITDVYIEDSQNDNENSREGILVNTINDDIDSHLDNEDDDSYYNDYSQLPLDLITQEKIGKMNKRQSELKDIENKTMNDNKARNDNDTQSKPIVQSYINEGIGNSKQSNSNGTSIIPIVIAGTSSSIPLPPKLPDNFFFKIPIPVPDTNDNNKPNDPPIKLQSIQEQIGDNPISKLKKIGSIAISLIKSNPNPNPKQGNNNLMDLLKEQINLRYQKLHKHQKEDDSQENNSISSDSN